MRKWRPGVGGIGGVLRAGLHEWCWLRSCIDWLRWCWWGVKCTARNVTTALILQNEISFDLVRGLVDKQGAVDYYIMFTVKISTSQAAFAK